jgi:MoaA/NifB/PqqE/SkfB family radical SAM enzyme
MWQDPYPDLITDDVKKILANLGRSSILLVSLEGGEPLMRPDIEEILSFARKQPFYLFITTSEKTLTDYPMSRYGPLIDFLHISIDEGHRNMEMFDDLESYTGWGPEVTVQTVVTRDTLPELDWKVQRCSEAGTMIVIMPAVDLDEGSDFYPDPELFRRSVARLKSEYPGTIIDPDGYLNAINSPHGCSAASIIIRSDGALYYPCRVLGDTVGNLVDDDLISIVKSAEAKRGRQIMAGCERVCGWYQYFSIRSYIKPGEAVPLLLQQLRRKKRQV